MEINIYWNKDLAFCLHGSWLGSFCFSVTYYLVVSIYKSQCDKTEPFKLCCYIAASIHLSQNKKQTSKQTNKLDILDLFQIKQSTTCILIIIKQF